jgi:hypothetical protein
MTSTDLLIPAIAFILGIVAAFSSSSASRSVQSKSGFRGGRFSER